MSQPSEVQGLKYYAFIQGRSSTPSEWVMLWLSYLVFRSGCRSCTVKHAAIPSLQILTHPSFPHSIQSFVKIPHFGAIKEINPGMHTCILLMLLHALFAAKYRMPIFLFLWE